ncbi:olfactory receptor 5V1-like [Microcaecilia unicolor]|uniref:Olfactory receptor n=1 Tax=Microcaecilia unicolor TaxID=1415580 RepID=A0A6P7XCL5_9AMPH|nr:olfactory receptor 5V1-like [Microcaecilia unicolor]
MEGRNGTIILDFILLGDQYLLKHSTLLFALLLIIYNLSLMGNSLILFIIKMDSRLHTPMYFFLSNLSLLEILYISTTVPIILAISLGHDKTISVQGCLVQIFFLHFLGCSECFLLAAMAYDRFVAICMPLHYGMLMKKSICFQLAVSCWVSGFLDALVLAVLTSKLTFCGPNKVANFFCDIPPLLKLACTDTHITEAMLNLAGIMVVLFPFFLIVLSYVLVITNILKIRSAQGRQKAFSTCAAHLTVVSLFYGTIIFIYFRPDSGYASSKDKLVSLVYTVLTPMLNPLIYSLRNNEVKEALKKVFGQKCVTLGTRTIA